MGWKDDFDNENKYKDDEKKSDEAWNDKIIEGIENLKEGFTEYFSENGATVDKEITNDAYGKSIKAVYGEKQKIELELDDKKCYNHNWTVERNFYSELRIINNYDVKIYGVIIGLAEKIDSNLSIDEKIEKFKSLNFKYSVFDKDKLHNHGVGIFIPVLYDSFYEALNNELK